MVWGFFKRLITAAVITLGALVTVGTGGIGGVGFWAAIKAVGWRGALGFFATNVILGEVANALTPKVRQPQGRLPVFASTSRSANIIGHTETSGLVTHIDEDDDDWLKVTYTIADHPCEVLTGLRVIGIFSFFNDWRNTNNMTKTVEHQTLVNINFSDRLRVFWNLTGDYDEDVSAAAGIPSEKKGSGLSWVCVWVKRDKFFAQHGFRLDAVRFRVARTTRSREENGENPARAIANHLQQYFGVKEEQIDQESLLKAVDVCDEIMPGGPQRVNGYWNSGSEYEVLQQLVDSMDGVVVQSRDKYFIYANSLSTDPAAEVVIEENMLLGEVFHSPLPNWDDLYNSCRATCNSNITGEPISTPRYVFPGYVSLDSGRDMTYNGGHYQFLDDAELVKRVITQKMARSRYSTEVHLSILEGLIPDLKTWDLVRLNIPSAGLTDVGEEYRITGMIIGLDGRLDLVLRREARSNWYPALHADGNFITPYIENVRPNLYFENPPSLPVGGDHGLMATAITENSITVEWGDFRNTESYELRVFLPGPIDFGYEPVLNIDRAQTAYTFENLKSDTEYLIELLAVSRGGIAGGYFITVRTEVATSTAGVPINFRAIHIGDQSLRFAWDEAPGANTYTIRHKRSTSAAWLHFTTARTEVQFVRLKADTDYDYQIRSNNSEGSSAYSETLVVRTGPFVGTPTIPVILDPSRPSAGGDTNTSFIVRWRSAAQADYYVVEYKRAVDGSWTVLNRLSSHVRLITGLSPNTLYQVRVKAVNEFGDSGYSDIKSIRTTINAPPPTGIPAKINDLRVTYAPDPIFEDYLDVNLNWRGDANADEYHWQARRDTESYASNYFTVTSTSATRSVGADITGTYYFHVRGNNPLVGLGAWSNEVRVVFDNI